ncbi:bifunctional diguanylate cyclase/phosphodiesterase [Paenibacillus sp. GP183]|uniref:sensor domain-containing protein n=1 Tax=Paenibacillus sp. GP183 TaxID=1882751 RepID=UPI000898E483|nr:bifunctional diguanylate cyclase/phosphodiesterase [Paenibacillus sp. GP183]SEC45221.1 diguanylate cyclase/phosphodiesterase [Paenibacillus sp. GP183]
MDKLIHIRKKEEDNKIFLRIIAVNLLFAALIPFGLQMKFPHFLFSVAGTIIAACLLYFMIRHHLKAVRQIEALHWEREEIKFRSTLESIQDGYYEMDAAGNYILINPSMVNILGIGVGNMQDRHYTNFMSKEDAQKMKQTYQWVYHTGKAVNCVEWEIIREDGTSKPVEGSIVLIRESADGMPTGFRGIVRDITERKDAQRMLEESRHRYKSLFDYNPDSVCSFELDGKFVTINPATEKIIGFTAHQLTGRTCGHLFQKERVFPIFKYFLRAKRGISSSFEISVQHKKGYYVQLQVRLVPIIIDKRVVGVYAISKDITENKQAEDTINHMAYHDALTDLPNRRHFIDHLTLALDQAARGHHKLAVLFLDLDRFKYINDSLGHTFGDSLLQTIAERLKTCVEGKGTIARMGGDEFTILLPLVTDEQLIVHTAESIIKVINKQIIIECHECTITTSIGISIYPNDGTDAQTLMMNADAAMYRAKESNHNKYQLFMPTMSTQASERLELEQELRKAVERNEFVLFYQPQLDFESGAITGVEALVRWQHPKRGMISPAEFIPLAEETGLIIPIGEWVLRTACRQNKEWQGAGFSPIRVAVNLSVYQFKQDNIINKVAEILNETGLNPIYLELEITESIAMQNPERIIITLEELKKLGIQISIDDFGTGYSSLSYLRDFPINRLKIDRSFVMDITHGSGDAVIASSIIAMAKSLSLEVIAEGVENELQFEFLKDKGCNEMQGYFFSKPLPAESIQARFSLV